jgi:hypothetical protein
MLREDIPGAPSRRLAPPAPSIPDEGGPRASGAADGLPPRCRPAPRRRSAPIPAPTSKLATAASIRGSRGAAVRPGAPERADAPADAGLRRRSLRGDPLIYPQQRGGEHPVPPPAPADPDDGGSLRRAWRAALCVPVLRLNPGRRGPLAAVPRPQQPGMIAGRFPDVGFRYRLSARRRVDPVLASNSAGSTRDRPGLREHQRHAKHATDQTNPRSLKAARRLSEKGDR